MKAKRPGYIGSALLRARPQKGCGTRRKDRPASVLRERKPLLTKPFRSIVVIVALSSCFLSAALLMPQTTDGGWDEPRARTAYASHAAIIITSDEGFTHANGVTGGEGTAESPYVIEGWEIDASFLGVGVMVSDTTKHYSVKNIHVLESSPFGIYVSNAPYGTIENCLLEGGTSGVVVSQSNHMSIAKNWVSNQSKVALEVSDCQWVDITGNRLGDRSAVGMLLNNVRNGTVSSNTVLQSETTGISIIGSDGISVVGNEVTDNSEYGIVLEWVVEVVVRDNSIGMNGECGLYLDHSADVMVFHNRFVENGVHALVITSIDVSWDAGYPSGGNYWSGNIVKDALGGAGQFWPGADGIVDLPYLILESGADRYPWADESMSYSDWPEPVFVPI